MNEHIVHPQPQAINLEKMTTDKIKILRQQCNKELDKRHKEEVRKFKAEFKRKAEKYGLAVTVETKK